MCHTFMRMQHYEPNIRISWLHYINRMILLAADSKRGQEMIDKFQRAYENLKKIVDRLEDKTGNSEISLMNTGRGTPPSLA